MSWKPASRTRRTRSRTAALVAGMATLLALSPAAHAQTTVKVGASVGGVVTGNVVQLPITAVVPIQVCSNNVAAGVAVAVNVLSGNGCAQEGVGVINADGGIHLTGPALVSGPRPSGGLAGSTANAVGLQRSARASAHSPPRRPPETLGVTADG